MSKLHGASLARIEDKDRVIFDALVEESEEFGNEVGQVCIPLIEEGDEFVEGTWVPELWLVVRKVLEEK